MKEPQSQQTLQTEEEVTLVTSGEEATLVAPRFDDEETLVAQPVVPLDGAAVEATHAPAPAPYATTTPPLPAHARRSRVPRRSWMLALVLTSVLVGGVLGGAGLYIYQRQSEDDRVVAAPQAETLTETPAETQPQPVAPEPAVEASNAPQPEAPAAVAEPTVAPEAVEEEEAAAAPPRASLKPRPPPTGATTRNRDAAPARASAARRASATKRPSAPAPSRAPKPTTTPRAKHAAWTQSSTASAAPCAASAHARAATAAALTASAESLKARRKKP